MHGPMKVKFPNNTSKWQMEFNSAFKGFIFARVLRNYSVNYVLEDVISIATLLPNISVTTNVVLRLQSAVT
jgi:hypothetical protein